VYYDQDSVTLPLSGPAYLEIFYAELNATVTLLLPEFAYGKTRAYLFLDAATNSVAETIKLKTLQGITIDGIVSEEYAPDVSKLGNLEFCDVKPFTNSVKKFRKTVNKYYKGCNNSP